MTRRRQTLLDELLHKWRRVRRNELARTIRHIKRQEKRREKRAAYIMNYVIQSIDSIDRAEGRRNIEEKTYLLEKD